MSDFSRERYNFGILDPALEQLERGQNSVAAGTQQRGRDMREDRNAGLQNIQQMISEGDEAASYLDPNDPEDAQALQAWQQEKSTLMDRISSMTGPDVLNTSLGVGGGQAIGDVRRRSVQAQQAREDEVAQRDTSLQGKLIQLQGGIDMRLQDAATEGQLAIDDNRLLWQEEEGDRDRAFQLAMQEAAQNWQGDEQERNRVLELALQNNGFRFQSEQNAKDRTIQQLRLGLDRDIAQADQEIAREQLSLAGRELDLREGTEDSRRNELVFGRASSLAGQIQGMEPGDQKDAAIERLAGRLEQGSEYLTDFDVAMLLQEAELDGTAEADEIRARIGLTEAQAAQVEGLTDSQAFQDIITGSEYIGGVAQSAAEAADQGQTWLVRDKLNHARSIVNNEGAWPEATVEAARSFLDTGRDFLDRAEEREDQVSQAEGFGLQQLENQVRSGAITLDAARREWAGNMAQQFETEEELEEYLNTRVAPGTWTDLFGGDETYGRQMIRLRFRAQKNAERQGQDVSMAQSLLESPNLDDPDGWTDQVIDAFTKDNVWGPESEDVIRQIAEQKLWAAGMGKDSALADIAHTNALAASALAQGEMYRAQAGAEAAEGEAARAMALLENLGALNDVLGTQLEAAQVEVESACNQELSTYESEACNNARLNLKRSMEASEGLYNEALLSIGIDPYGDEPIPSRQEAIEGWATARNEGVPFEQVLAESTGAAGFYREELEQIYQGAIPHDPDQIRIYGPEEEPTEGALSSLPQLARSLGGWFAERAQGYVESAEDRANRQRDVRDWITAGDTPAVNWTPWNDEFEIGGRAPGETSPREFREGNPRPAPREPEDDSEGDRGQPVQVNREGIGSGALVEQAESGGDPAAIGQSNTDGYSYGLYQLSSKQGSVGSFIRWLDNQGGRYGPALRGAGGERAAKEGSDTFKQAWRDLSRDEEFAALQRQYAQESYHEPAAQSFEEATGFDPRTEPTVMEAVISTAIQHGGGGLSTVVSRALRGKDIEGMTASEVVQAIYDERLRENEDGVLLYFVSSEPGVREGVRNRLERERDTLISGS